MTSIASEEIYLETADATFECVLDTDDDSVQGSMPPPPPPKRKSRSKSPIWRIQPKDVEAPERPKTCLIEQMDGIEAQALPDSRRGVQRNGRKRRCLLAFACILVALTVMAVVMGVKRSEEEEGGQSFSVAGFEAGAEEEQDGGDADFSDSAAPSTAPSAAPSAGTAPSAAPSSAPSECENTLIASKQCYLVGEEIQLAFVNCDPTEDDWIGIYSAPAISDLSDLGIPIDWLWTCGTQDCAGEVMVDALPFGDGLAAGTYEAHLVRRNSGGPYSSYVGTGFDFSVAETC